MMAGNPDIWSSPEPAVSMLPFSSSIEWVPLPEVKTLRESQSYSNLHNIVPNGTYNSHSSPVMNSTVSHLDNIQSTKTPTNLTILSLGSSLTNQSTSHPIINSQGTPLSSNSGPSASIPHLDPSHLDELWKQFLKTVVIPSNNGYGCNCHLKPSENEPVFNPLPLGKENESVANNGHMYRTQTPHSKTIVPIDTPFSYSYSSKETQTGTVPRYEPIIDVTTPLHMESTPTLEKLSLQEACYLMKKKFIINSKKRQETIKQKMAKRELQPWQRELQPWQPKAPPIIKPSTVYPTS